jgi:hypothetical protein
MSPIYGALFEEAIAGAIQGGYDGSAGTEYGHTGPLVQPGGYGLKEE